ncbi:MAG: class I SAM-dependent methyltransferase [Nitrososphaerales archaeon]
MIHSSLLLPLFILILLTTTAYLLLSGYIWGAGYEPTKKSIRNQLIGILEERFHQEEFVFYDLGSGFGGVLLDVAERFPNSFYVGIETDPFKCVIARRRVRKLGLEGHVIITKGNLLKTDFSDADAVYMFLSPLILRKQEFRNVIKKLKPECLIISYCHRIPGVEPTVIVGKDLFVYTRSLF